MRIKEKETRLTLQEHDDDGDDDDDDDDDIHMYFIINTYSLIIYWLVQAFRLTSNHLYFRNATRILQVSLEYTIANRNV